MHRSTLLYQVDDGGIQCICLAASSSARSKMAQRSTAGVGASARRAALPFESFTITSSTRAKSSRSSRPRKSGIGLICRLSLMTARTATSVLSALLAAEALPKLAMIDHACGTKSSTSCAVSTVGSCTSRVVERCQDRQYADDNGSTVASRHAKCDRRLKYPSPSTDNTTASNPDRNNNTTRRHRIDGDVDARFDAAIACNAGRWASIFLTLNAPYFALSSRIRSTSWPEYDDAIVRTSLSLSG
ncbi:hypothetical protein H310_01423 [Aphanomyces invadans]|uniref:Uncharacterized protein n=1 Tax=Aphanomyces invadans TaxID=157072 RepID=A0A024UR97_9STRA|nr:hypothetical protein H310_01423 [Aphanomyces invadans]ETW08941.1 hypothetical protein H310_01423 [Aphanomyces invadans]|eukprot:XP_008862746.1 hypothetical protein H310_01423 [Aphanomyces invadans]